MSQMRIFSSASFMDSISSMILLLCLLTLNLMLFLSMSLLDCCLLMSNDLTNMLFLQPVHLPLFFLPVLHRLLSLLSCLKQIYLPTFDHDLMAQFQALLASKGSYKPGIASTSERLMCQLCFKKGHTADICYKRFDSRYKPPPPPPPFKPRPYHPLSQPYQHPSQPYQWQHSFSPHNS
jgi:hypothetical protein